MSRSRLSPSKCPTIQSLELFYNIKIVAMAKEVGVLPPEAPQWPNSSSGGCANYVPGDVRWLHDDRDCDDESGLLRWGTPT